LHPNALDMVNQRADRIVTNIYEGQYPEEGLLSNIKKGWRAEQQQEA
jgi:hypothetical protein